jgi:putative ABC transport system substrate-binding protein
VKRRQFIAGLGSAAAWPLAARAQQPERRRRIGVLTELTEGDPQSRAELAALREGLTRSGWIEGRNLQSTNRLSAGDDSRLYSHAEELVLAAPDVIISRGTKVTAILKQRTSTIPIVFVPVSDPIASGFVTSIARPAGNLTGFIDEEFSFGGKWLSILRELAPSISRVMMLYDHGNANWAGYLRALQAAGSSAKLSVTASPVTAAGEIVRHIETFATEPGGGLIVVPSSFMIVNRETVVGLTAAHRLPAVYPYKFYAASGGLASYGPDHPDLWRRAAEYVDRILRGGKPGDMPVQSPTKFEFVINLKTTKALGLTIPETLLATADEVIQ